MSIFKNAFATIKNNKEKVESGLDICIPMPKEWDRLTKAIPGIIKGRYWLVGAASKVGKTSYSNALFFFHPLLWLWENKDKTNIDIKILYYSLEISKQALAINLFSHILYVKYNIIVSPGKLQSYFKGFKVEDSLLELIRKEKDFLDFVETKVEIIDNIRHPYGIFTHTKEFFEANGTWTKRPSKYKNEAGELVDTDKKDTYVPNNPNLHTIVITDHISLLEYKNGATLHESISKFSSEYCIELRDKYEAIIVNVQQMSAASEEKTFDNKGKLNINKLKPTQNLLGDNKLTVRDCDYMLSLFDPARYDIDEYEGFDLKTDHLGNYYRELIININRHGFTLDIPCFFLGASGYFKELPDMSDMSKALAAYSKIRRVKQIEEEHFKQ